MKISIPKLQSMVNGTRALGHLRVTLSLPANVLAPVPTSRPSITAKFCLGVSFMSLNNSVDIGGLLSGSKRIGNSQLATMKIIRHFNDIL